MFSRAGRSSWNAAPLLPSESPASLGFLFGTIRVPMPRATRAVAVPRYMHPVGSLEPPAWLGRQRPPQETSKATGEPPRTAPDARGGGGRLHGMATMGLRQRLFPAGCGPELVCSAVFLPGPERRACPSLGTHTVLIHFPQMLDETWLVCREHDRQRKVQAVRSRPKRPPEVEETRPNVVRCSGCDRVLEEPSDAAVRGPCPHCGSLARRIEVYAFDSATAHEGVRVRARRTGKTAWFLATTTGDDYTRDLVAWGKRELTMDREKDLYREVIELWDGTRIESTARLSDHRDR